MNKEILKEILDLHLLYLSSNGQEGKCANLKDADLEGADLNGAYLEGTNLEFAYLEGANLNGAYLEGTNLECAYLEGANLQGADLNGAILRGTNLENAILHRAYLENADLEGANGLPNISAIKPGCLVELNNLRNSFFVEKQDKYENFDQDSIGVIIQNNVEENTFDMLTSDEILRNIPEWVKYSGIKKILSASNLMQ